MLKKTKWRNQNPRKVIKKPEFKEWLLKEVKKAVNEPVSPFLLGV